MYLIYHQTVPLPSLPGSLAPWLSLDFSLSPSLTQPCPSKNKQLTIAPPLGDGTRNPGRLAFYHTEGPAARGSAAASSYAA